MLVTVLVRGEMTNLGAFESIFAHRFLHQPRNIAFSHSSSWPRGEALGGLCAKLIIDPATKLQVVSGI